MQSGTEEKPCELVKKDEIVRTEKEMNEAKVEPNRFVVKTVYIVKMFAIQEGKLSEDRAANAQRLIHWTAHERSEKSVRQTMVTLPV